MIKFFNNILIASLIIFIFFSPMQARSATVEYELDIALKPINITGKSVQGMTVNGNIPGPVLRFKEGDTARIHVHNMMNINTSIHWHGILVPPDMDGVPNISFPPIAPGETFTYEFPVRQSGTYWYHSHSELQEQSGVYGAIVIEPSHEHRKTDRDYVIVLSDWTDEDPHEVLRTLKMGSEWYAIQKGSGQSILGAARLGMLGDYFKRELQRMPPMDISDVAYDRFLANGSPETSLYAEPGETVRLRVIDGSATTYFHLEFAGGPVQIISADGQDVEPFEADRFLIGVAETYDVILKIPGNRSYEFRATAHDGSSYASVWIGDGMRSPANDIPRPNLYHSMGGLEIGNVFALTPAGSMGMNNKKVEAGIFDKPGMMSMESMDMDNAHEMGAGGMMGDTGMEMEHQEHQPASDRTSPASAMDMEHGNEMETDGMMSDTDMEAEQDNLEGASHGQADRSGKVSSRDFSLLGTDVSSSGELAMDGMDQVRPWSPYSRLRSIQSTAFSEDKPVREIRLTLDGDMERYVWFMNNKALSESDDILIKEGEIVRFIMINRTMMHHPMHLHGHFFRVINGQGDYSPLKHTVDVAPMSTTVIEFEANELGDWFFHCHLLYHMKSGMARLVHYDNFILDPRLAEIRPNLYKDSWYFWVQANALSNMTSGAVKLSSTRNILTGEWEAGWQDVGDTAWETIFTWDYYISRFFTVLAGADLTGLGNDPEETRAVFGIRYLLPFNLESRWWVDSEGNGRVGLEKSFSLTPRLQIHGEAQYDTHDKWERAGGLSFIINKHFSLIGEWHSSFGLGAGLQFRF